MKLNIGCGTKPIQGYVNIDIEKRFKKDNITFIKWDLNKPLPFNDDMVEEVYANHVLEHIDSLYGLMKELHRVCKNDSPIVINIPHFTSVGNPYEFHVRQCRYNFLAEFCIDSAKCQKDVMFVCDERRLSFTGFYSFMNILNFSRKLCEMYEGSFLRSLFFASEVQLRLTVYKSEQK